MRGKQLAKSACLGICICGMTDVYFIPLGDLPGASFNSRAEDSITDRGAWFWFYR